jgi:hypothetical protein
VRRVSDDNSKDVKGTIANEAKGLAVEVYKDAAKPTLGELGHVLGGVTKLLLTPLRKLVDGANAALDRLGRDVGTQLRDVPPERLLPPPATIAGNVALHYAMLGDGDDVEVLREMFAKLLATSMDREANARTHPAFATVISQLTSDEAWILKSIDRVDYAAFDLFTSASPPSLDRVSLGPCSLLGVGAGIDESRQPQYLSNLDRLAIIKIDWGNAVADRKEYDQLTAYVDARYGRLDAMMNGGVISVTPFGRDFLEACVGVRVPSNRVGLMGAFTR